MFPKKNMYQLFKCCLFNNQIFRRFSNLSFSVKETLSQKPYDKDIVIQGWVQSVRKHKNLYFVDIVDGSCLERLQVVIDVDKLRSPSYGSSIRVEGKLVKSNHKGQEVELLSSNWNTLGSCTDDYPFSNRTKYSSEYVREYLHLRPRTKTFGSVLRVRSCASLAVHNFFQNKGFHYIHTPLITTNDCEGAGEVFSIQTDKANMSIGKSDQHMSLSLDKIERKNSFFESMTDSDEDVSVDENQKEFFGVPAYLSVSGQLHLEAAACGLSRVYCFGPVFRAEGSHSRQHASEFYMIEAELAFIESLECLTKLTESCIKEVADSLLTSCSSEINWINDTHQTTYNEYIKKVISEPFVTMPYSDAIDILQKDQQSLKTEVKFGKDFSSEHKQYLVRHCNNTPVIVTMFPSAIKPFYMKDDSQGLAYCFDVLAPFGGEICGGSLREDCEETLRKKLEKLKIDDTLAWYLDLRKYGGVPLGGFGIGFDRLLQSILGIPNIKDIIPFPRRRNDCRC